MPGDSSKMMAEGPSEEELPINKSTVPRRKTERVGGGVRDK